MRSNRRALRGVASACLLAITGIVYAQPWTESDAASKLLSENKFAEAAEAFGKLAKENPFNGYAWGQLGYCLHSEKKYEEAIKAYARAIELGQGRPSNLYNTACAHALLGHKDEALDWLRKSLEARFAEQQTLETDTDMDSLRSDPRFAELTGITKDLKEKPASNREDGWRWDLDFYLRRMKQMHWDLYARVPEATLKRELDALKAGVGSLSDNQVRARLRKITALVGDGHTSSRLYAEGDPTRILQLHMFIFKEGLYVIGASPANAELVGTRIVKIGSLDAAAAIKAVRAYSCVDNEMGYTAWAPGLLAIPSLLQEIGAVSDESGVQFTGEKPDGTRINVRVEPVEVPPTSGGLTLKPGYTYVHDAIPADRRPLYLREPGTPLRMEHLADQKTVYFWFGAVANPSGQSFADFVAKMFEFINSNDVEHLVIDMRFNGGGNTGLVAPLIEGIIKCEKVNRQGHLWVITGRHTFSAAQNTVNLMDGMTQAVFVGEPTGSCPHFVGESTSFMLPHSRTRVFCSSRYWQLLDSTDERTFVPPQVLAEPTFATYSANRDPAMEAITTLMKK